MPPPPFWGLQNDPLFGPKEKKSPPEGSPLGWGLPRSLPKFSFFPRIAPRRHNQTGPPPGGGSPALGGEKISLKSFLKSPNPTRGEKNGFPFLKTFDGSAPHLRPPSHPPNQKPQTPPGPRGHFWCPPPETPPKSEKTRNYPGLGFKKVKFLGKIIFGCSPL